MPVYDSEKLLEAYAKYGELPHIHQAMLTAFRKHVVPGATVIDLGSSVGLLSAGLRHSGARYVMAFEGNVKANQRRILTDNVTLYPYQITAETVSSFEAAIKICKPTVCVARRVIYEIEKTGVLETMVRAMYVHGVKQVLLQGCVPVRNPKVRLWNSELEALALRSCYQIKAQHGPVYYLEAV